ncbi:hypothetical protein LXA43DRAFT_1005754 [Ganoderma leucocontextum]|nr:hypothetical protein LXA43DRAFT_1005754 [Ganoderma leucocontextum]
MPRLQITRRTSLLSTNLRIVFLEAFGRNISPDATHPRIRRSSDAFDFHAVARRVQAEIRRATGRYCPLGQVISSIQDLPSDRSDNRTSPVNTPRSPTPRLVPIIITSATPTSSVTSVVDSSMSLHRIACNSPTMQSQLPMPLPWVPSTSTSPLNSPSGLSPTYTFASAPFIRRSHSSGSHTSQPITPIDQIARPPLTPPKLPRLVAPAPGTWSRLNVQARKDGVSPIEASTLPLALHSLRPMVAGKPILDRLQIPNAATLGACLSAPLTPSPQTLSPFDIGRGQFHGAHSPTLEGTKSVLARTSSSSNLTRAALLRLSRPALAHNFSQIIDLRNASERAASPLLSPFSGPRSALGSPLASPFAIRPEGGYSMHIPSSR